MPSLVGSEMCIRDRLRLRSTIESCYRQSLSTLNTSTGRGFLHCIEFIRARQAASRTVKPRCLAFTPVSERSRFPAAPYLATCHLFATRQRATYRWGGFSFEMTSGVENSRVEAGFSDTLWSLRTVSLSGQLALRPSDLRRPVESKSFVARLIAPAGIHRGQAAFTGKYRARVAGRKFSCK